MKVPFNRGSKPLPCCSDTHVTVRAISDHFDGMHFFNPTLPRNSVPSFFSIFRLFLTKRGAWPKTEENIATPSLKTTLREDEISFTFVNHATFLIQTNGVNILTDPVWSERASPFRWIGPKRVRPPGVELKALPRIDEVGVNLISYLFVAQFLGCAKNTPAPFLQ